MQEIVLAAAESHEPQHVHLVPLSPEKTKIHPIMAATLVSAVANSISPGHEKPTQSKLLENVDINVLEVEPQNSRWLIHSPYTEREHQLDLETLDDENALLARALARMRCLRADYATAPYTESFNWDEVHQELRDLIQKTGKTFKETSFYVVAFRSTVPPSTHYEDLGVLDKAAHREANEFGGFLK